MSGPIQVHPRGSEVVKPVMVCAARPIRKEPSRAVRWHVALFWAVVIPFVLTGTATETGASAARGNHARKLRQHDVRADQKRAGSGGAIEGGTKSERAASDDLYRQRGYGTGGLVFGLGQGGTAQAGDCADLGFARPPTCGPSGGYGIYGNGLGYGFGF